MKNEFTAEPAETTLGTSGEPARAEQHIRALQRVLPFLLLAVLLVPGWPVEIRFLVATLLGGLIFSVQRPDRPRPAYLVVTDEGLHLPIAEHLFLPTDQIDVIWLSKMSTWGGRRRLILCIQCRPRRQIDVPWYTIIRGVRTNTLLQGDIAIDLQAFGIDLTSLTEAIEKRLGLTVDRL